MWGCTTVHVVAIDSLGSTEVLIWGLRHFEMAPHVRR